MSVKIDKKFKKCKICLGWFVCVGETEMLNKHYCSHKCSTIGKELENLKRKE